MIKNITLGIFASLLIVGCGAGGETKSSSGSSTSRQQSYADGKYKLWEYLVPSKSSTNTFALKTNKNTTSTYKTAYKVNRSEVTETSDYAANETTIYTKKENKITVSFQKKSRQNGTYDLKLSADIGDRVTIRPSSCSLKAHYVSKEIAGNTFQDVIEIQCDGHPGYYQKGTGEVGQEEANKDIRVLTRS